LLAVSLCSVLAIAGLSAILVWHRGDAIMRLLNASDLIPYLWLIPLALLADGVFLALNYWNSRTKAFGRLSIARVGQSIVRNGSQLGFGMLGQPSAASLIAGQVLGSAVVASILGGQIWQDDQHTLTHSIRPRRMLKWAKRHRKFPLLNTWSALLNAVSWQLPTFLLTAFFSPAVVGYYALGNRVLQAPMSLVGSAVAQVFLQRASEARNTGTDMAAVVTPLFRRLVAIGIFPMLLLTIIGKDVFVTVFGDRWSEAGVYVQILGLWVFVQFISSPLSTLFSVMERQGGALLLNGLILATRFAALSIGGVLDNPRIALVLFAATGVLVYGGLCAWILTTSGVPRSRAWGILRRSVLISALIVSPVAALKLFTTANSLVLVAVGGVACGIYGLILIRDEPDLHKHLWGLVG